MIEKGVISTVNAEEKTVTVVPSFSDSPVTAALTIPFFLIGALETGMPVVYAQFPDNTGVVLCRLDGEWNHMLEGDAEFKGELTVGGNVTASDFETDGSGSYNAHVQTYGNHKHTTEGGGQTSTPV